MTHLRVRLALRHRSPWPLGRDAPRCLDRRLPGRRCAVDGDLKTDTLAHQGLCVSQVRLSGS
jgi:hypothetical protein